MLRFIFSKFIITTIFLYSFSTLSQVKIQGKVIDAESGKIVPYCSILIKDTFQGTSSNEEGEFVIKVEKLPAKLIFSHISFNDIEVVIEESRNVLVKIMPTENVLEEVNLITDNKQKDTYAISLARKAYKKLLNESQKSKYGKAFYRQKSKNGKEYSELAEIIFDTRFSVDGIEDWDIIEGRYALKKHTVNNKNYTLFSKIIRSIQPDTEDLIFPLNSNFEFLYDVYLIEKIKSNSKEIAVLKFKPKPNQIPIFTSDVYVNTLTNSVLKIESYLYNDDLDLVEFNEEGVSKKNYQINYEISFKENKDLGLLIDYIKVDQEFDYFKNNIFKTKVATTSNLTFFEYYNNTISKKRLGKQFKGKTSDWDKLNTIGYNNEFWENNPIISRTPTEEEVIADFEKENAFESIYINSRNQIAFTQKEVLNDSLIKSLLNETNIYNFKNPIEKVFLNTDKVDYYSGESLWYSAYSMLTKNSLNLLSSKLLYIDLINSEGTVVLTEKKKLIDGRTAGVIKIPRLNSGSYLLKAYTPWMQNNSSNFYFSKRIKVLGVNSDENKQEDNSISLDFFPEGGNLIANINTKIAFKAIGIDGLGKKVKGRILDSNKKLVANFKSVYYGAGYFTLKPRSGEKYIAVLDNGKEFNLPKVIDDGLSLQVHNINKRSVLARVFAPKGLRNYNVYIIGQMENKVLYQGKFDFGGNNFIDIEVPKSNLPSGVLTLTVLDQQKLPISERVVFINNYQELVVEAKVDKKKINPREKVKLDVLVTDTNGKPVVADLSIAVTDKAKVKKNQFSTNILTYFLMESDLKGNIENPFALFKDDSRATRYKLDLVMLTNGWRKLSVKNLEFKNNDNSITDVISFRGLVKDFKNNILKNNIVNTVAKSKDKILMYYSKTDENGILELKNLDHDGEIELVFNVLGKDNEVLDKARVIEIEKKSEKNQILVVTRKEKRIKVSENDTRYMNNTKVVNKLPTVLPFDDDDSIELDEVTVKGKRKRKKVKGSPSVYGVNPDRTIYTEGRHENRITDLLMGVSGISVLGNTLSIRGGGAPLYVIDGMPVLNESDITALNSSAFEARSSDDEGGITDEKGGLLLNRSVAIPQQVLDLSVYEIERIEVLKGPSAAIYGLRGANGAILIYSKQGGGYIEEKKKSLPKKKIKGYSVAREFYSPKYNVKTDLSKKDKRSTLYWNPSVITDSKGKATVYFYNSDQAKEVEIDIQGLSLYGYPGVFLKTFGNK